MKGEESNAEEWLRTHNEELVVIPDINLERFKIVGTMIRSEPCPRCGKIIAADLRPFAEQIRQKGYQMFHNRHTNCFTPEEKRRKAPWTVGWTVGESAYVVWTKAENYMELVWKLQTTRAKLGGAPMNEISK